MNAHKNRKKNKSSENKVKIVYATEKRERERDYQYSMGWCVFDWYIEGAVNANKIHAEMLVTCRVGGRKSEKAPSK